MALDPKRRHHSAQRRRANRARGQRRGHRRVRATRVQAGSRYKITRRCLERRLFLNPDEPYVRQVCGYLLGVCAKEYGILIHSACFMGNHYHLDVTDTRGQFPAFKNKFNSMLAKALNARRGRFDTFWSGGSSCDVELVSGEDVVDRMAYTLANPVSAGLVRRSTRWPGLTTAGVAFGTTLTFERPDQFFDHKNPANPDTASFTVVRPAVLPELSDEEFQAELEHRVAERERDAADKLRAEHRRFLGESRLSRQRWNEAPRNREERFGIRPTVAGTKWGRIAALQRNKEWDAAYAEAYDARLRGEDYVFPYGTYAEVRFRNAPVAEAPS